MATMVTSALKAFRFNQNLAINLGKSGMGSPTPFQAAVMPFIIQGKDVIAIARESKVRTQAYMAPIINNVLNKPTGNAQALILVSSGESAERTLEVIKSLSVDTNLKSIAVYGKTASIEQQKALRLGVDIVVGNPACLLDCLWKELVNPNSVKTFVLDEGDKLAASGQMEDIFNILMSMGKKKQSILFTATMPENLRKLSRQFLHQPVSVTDEPAKAPTAPAVKKQTVPAAPARQGPVIRSRANTEVLRNHIKKANSDAVLVFTHYWEHAHKVAKMVTAAGYQAAFFRGQLPSQGANVPPKGVPTGPVLIVLVTDHAMKGLDMARVFRAIDDAGGTRHIRHMLGRHKENKAFSLVTNADDLILFVLDKSLMSPLVETNR
jgi:ATP-dependent RNA helicase RhlE